MNLDTSSSRHRSEKGANRAKVKGDLTFRRLPNLDDSVLDIYIGLSKFAQLDITWTQRGQEVICPR